MPTTINLQARADLASGGHVELVVDADLAALDDAGRELVGSLLDLIGHHALATRPPTAGLGAVDELHEELEPQPGGSEPDREAGPTPIAVAASGGRTGGTSRQAPKPKATHTQVPDLGVRLLRALHESGGEMFDPKGGAATRLFEAASVGANGVARKVLAVLDEAGHITRAVNGKRTTRIVLTPKGLAVVDNQASGVDANVPATYVPENDSAGTPTSTSKGVASMCLSGQHALCAAAPGRCTCDCHAKAKGRAAA